MRIESEQRPDDGRNLDPLRGVLRGEGAGLSVGSPQRAHPSSPEPSPEVSSEAEAGETYYEQPILKEPVWIWTIPAYFFVGGVAGASAVLASAAQVIDPRGLQQLIRQARGVSAVGVVLGAGLLVADLGRPERFLNMLRVFRPTSPMSMGSWILTGSGAAGTLAFVLFGKPGALGRIGDGASYVAGALGLGLAGYTGVLLSATSVPVWLGGRRSLPALFLASAAASAGSLLGLLPVGRRGREVARRFAVMGALGELVLGKVYEKEVSASERAARPLREGLPGRLLTLSRALSLSGLAIDLLSGRRSRTRAFAGVFQIAGAVAMRAAVFAAGKASARDPRATIQQQRGPR